MATYRLTVEYEGTRFHGWQEQENARTISGEIKRAVGEIADLVDLGGSGRTDSGVHALAQTAHLRLRNPVDPAPFRRELNDRLPPDIHVLEVRAAADGFHARHDARSRSYLYQISRRRTAFAKRYVWWVREPLGPERMARAASLLPGSHDFARFCERPSQQSSTLVVMERVEIEPAGALLLIRLVASHFLWKLVRRLVGSLVKVGTGELSLEEFAALIEGSAERSRAGRPAEWTAPPSGLFLERVLYPGDAPLAALAPAFPVPALEDEGTAAPPAGVRTRSRSRPQPPRRR